MACWKIPELNGGLNRKIVDKGSIFEKAMLDYRRVCLIHVYSFQVLDSGLHHILPEAIRTIEILRCRAEKAQAVRV